MESFRQLAEALHDGAAVLATVIEVQGSVPREVGAKLIVCAGGRVRNTIGGGAGEAKVIRQAKEILRAGSKHSDHSKQLIEIDLSGAPHRETEGICGGTMQIWLERWEGDRAIALVQEILNRLDSGKTVRLATPLTPRESPYLLPDDAPAPTLAFVECLQPPPTLLIVGAGHVGIELAKVAELIGFKVTVQDDRSEWANVQHYSDATQILTEPVAVAARRFATDDGLYVALVTRAYQYDLDALKVILKREHPCRYIGMIGSERRVRRVYRAIKRSGISEAELASIYAPIGLDVGARSPAEIAVSIGAELILVRRGGSGQSLSAALRHRLTKSLGSA